jgi:hypothetical protein
MPRHAHARHRNYDLHSRLAAAARVALIAAGAVVTLACVTGCGSVRGTDKPLLQEGPSQPVRADQSTSAAEKPSAGSPQP